jgi:epoxyqueuosine reductase
MTLKARMMRAFKTITLKPLIAKLEAWEKRAYDLPGAMRGGDNSPVRFNIPREGLKAEGDHPPLPGIPSAVPQLLGSVINIRKSLYDLDRNPPNGRKQIDPQTLGELIQFAHSAGADEVGFTPVPQEWVFRDTAIRFTNAVVLVKEMSKERIDHAPSRDTAIMVHETYNALGQVSNRIAAWLRERGYAVHAGHPLGGMALYPPMAQAAGLGYRGINGLIITPRFGPRVRLAAVFMEIENLPVYEGDEHAWVLDFCQTCRRCIRECPPGAIYESPIEHDNGLVTVLDNAKCFPYFLAHHACSLCIKVCPFSQQSYDKIKSGFLGKRAEHVRVPQREI